MQNLRAALVARRNGDGGWGYLPAKASRLEPTCWALLADARASGQPVALDVLSRWPRQGDWLVDVPGAPVNYAFNALGALTALASPGGAPIARRIAEQLIQARGLRFDQGKEIRQDNSLQAWPWIDGTFSWVEPTCLCLLLLKKLRAELPAAPTGDRIDIGERMLRDRACAAGGWNYGGSNVYGQELFPYVPTTALGLLALQDHKNEPVVIKALAWLQKEAATEPSALALALSLISFRVHRVAAGTIEQTLRSQAASVAERSNTVGLASALYALTKADGDTTFGL